MHTFDNLVPLVEDIRKAAAQHGLLATPSNRGFRRMPHSSRTCDEWQGAGEAGKLVMPSIRLNPANRRNQMPLKMKTPETYEDPRRLILEDPQF